MYEAMDGSEGSIQSSNRMDQWSNSGVSQDTAALLRDDETSSGRSQSHGGSPRSPHRLGSSHDHMYAAIDPVEKTERYVASLNSVPEKYLRAASSSEDDVQRTTAPRVAAASAGATSYAKPGVYSTSRAGAYDEDDDATVSESNRSSFLDDPAEVSVDRFDDARHRVHSPRTPKSDETMWPLLDELTSLEEELRKEACKLRAKKQKLKAREQRVSELERLACESHDRLARCAELEVTHRWSKLEEERQGHAQSLVELVKQRDGEVQRLEASFAAMREANHELKQKVSKLELENSAFSKQLSSSQRRVRNLQVRTQLQDRQQSSAEVVRQAVTKAQKEQGLKSHSRSSASSTRSSQSSLASGKIQFERYVLPFCSLLEWVVDAQLMSSWKKVQHGPPKMSPDEFQAQCARFMPLAVELLTTCDVSTMASQVAIPCLRFALTSSRFITHSTVSAAVQSQRASLLMMFRHLGEAMTRPKSASQPSILASASWHVQLLSSLFVLANVNRTDIVLHAFDVLRNSLRNAVQKSTFLNHHGMTIVVAFMRSSTAQALVSAAVDVHLHLVNEPAILDRFLHACSNEDWFHSVSCLLRDHKNFVLAEKLSIVLQRLAEGRHAHQYFVTHQLVPIAEQLIQTCGPDKAFLVLNLRSMISLITGVVKDSAGVARKQHHV